MKIAANLLATCIVTASMTTDAFQAALSQSTIKPSPLTLLNALPRSTGHRTRRAFVIASTAFVGSVSISKPALAKYGESSNLEIPNYIDYLIEKNSSFDEENSLYKGADPSVLLGRLQEADKRLKDIPVLAEQKKWSQISGIITGPLGTLSQTLNQIATPDSSPQVKEAAKKLKSVVIDIGQAASKKNADVCTTKAQQASSDLQTFVKAAFE